MDKEFILGYLKKEHVANNEGLAEIAELSGIETVKSLLKNHESMKLTYIPVLSRNKMLMIEVIKSNYQVKSLKELSDLTGLSRDKVKCFIKEIEDFK